MNEEMSDKIDLLKNNIFHFPINVCYSCKKIVSSHVILSYRVVNGTELMLKYLLLCNTCYCDYVTMHGLLSF